VLGALPEADCCVAGFQAATQHPADSVAAGVAAGCLADALAAPVSSAESPAHDCSAAAAAPEDDCSRGACPDTVAAAAQGLGRDDWQMAGAGPAAQCDRCLQEHYEYLEEQADCQEHRAEEHYHSDGHPEHCYWDHCY
jgi:hypothetical protein